MGMKITLLSFVVGLMLIAIATTQEDSLKSALNAVDRKQRDLSVYPQLKNELGKGSLAKFYKPDEIIANDRDNERENLEKALFDYLEGEKTIDSDHSTQGDGTRKRLSSSFRERIEEDNERQEEELATTLYNELESEREYEDDEKNKQLMQKLWAKYKHAYPAISESDPLKIHSSSIINKRPFPGEYYTNLGYASIGLKKRSRYFEPDGPSESLYLQNYAPRDEMFDRMQEQELDNLDLASDYYNWNLNKHVQPDKVYLNNYSTKKLFPVKKRSSISIQHDAYVNQHSKRSPNKENTSKTDPKVAKDLSNIFGTVKETVEVNDKPKKSMTKKAEKPFNKPQTTENNAPPVAVSNKNHLKKEKLRNSEEILPNTSKQEYLQIKKKSVDWSDYFGYDRRKKSEDIDNEWLMERYHKSVAMANKREADYQTENVHNHNIKVDNIPGVFNKQEEKTEARLSDHQLADMDSALKEYEEDIIDDALKLTGAHQGTQDLKEIEAVNDEVISQLAAAYSLERMRQAIAEYRISIAKHKVAGKAEEYSPEEQKRVSVPRKQAIDEEREKATEMDNNIKCSQTIEECMEDTYRTPSDIVEEVQLGKGQCSKVQRACNEMADVIGKYGHILEDSCNVHQMCLLCGENGWFAPTRKCNVLFLSKADEVCDGDIECQKIARHAIRYLLDVNRSLRAEPSDDCDLVCPSNY